MRDDNYLPNDKDALQFMKDFDFFHDLLGRNIDDVSVFFADVENENVMAQSQIDCDEGSARVALNSATGTRADRGRYYCQLAWYEAAFHEACEILLSPLTTLPTDYSPEYIAKRSHAIIFPLTRLIFKPYYDRRAKMFYEMAMSTIDELMAIDDRELTEGESERLDDAADYAGWWEAMYLDLYGDSRRINEQDTCSS